MCHESKYQRTSFLSLNYISLFFLVVFSTWYITKLPVSPVYVTSLVGFVFSLFFLAYRRFVKFDFLIGLSLVIVSYLTVVQLFFLKPDFNTFLNVVFSFLVFIFVRLLLPSISIFNVVRLSRLLILVSLPLLIFESFYRILNPPQDRFDFYVATDREDLLFYVYKFNSIMFQDSNFVGMLILSLFFFSIYYFRYTSSKSTLLYSTTLFFLLLATLSRAAIFSSFLFLLLFPLRNFIYVNRKFVFFVLILITPFLFLVAVKLSDFDESFASRFYILNNTYLFISNASFFEVLFGVGFGNAVEVLHIGSHNFFVALLVEGGLLGLFFVMLLWLNILFKSNYAAGIVIFPFLLAGLSFSSLALPYLYAVFALILEMEDRK